MKFKKCSQAGQDKFVLDTIGDNGTYIEIGAHLPQKRSNTYNLECIHGYKGFSVELNEKKYRSHWLSCVERQNPIIWQDALTIDYRQKCRQLDLPLRINYLSVDIEPPENTFQALKKIIEDGISFDVITFEHDWYQSNKNYHDIAVEYLIPFGYRVAVYDVFHKNESRIFETWFVNKNIEFKKQSYKNWITKNHN